MNIDNLKKWAAFAKQKKNLKAELEDIKDEMAILEPILLNEMADLGIASIKFDNHSIYISSRIWAKIKNKDNEAANVALIAAGMDDYLKTKFNHISLSAFVSECITNGEGLPKSFEGIISANEVFQLKSIKA